MIYTVNTDEKIIKVPRYAPLTEIVRALAETEFVFEDYEIKRDTDDETFDPVELNLEGSMVDGTLRKIPDFSEMTDGVAAVKVTKEQFEKIIEAILNK